MVRPVRFLRPALATALAALAVAGLTVLTAIILRPRLPQNPPAIDPAAAAAATAARDTSFDPANPPRNQVPVDTSAGPAAPWWPKGESPLFAAHVATGDLPPVADRVGPEPVVLRGPDGIGSYGGTWHRVAISNTDMDQVGSRFSNAALFRFSPLGLPIVPHVALAYEASPDFRTWTIRLRRIRWSDGHPLTADDVLYKVLREDLYFSSLAPGGPAMPEWLRVEGEPATSIEKVDDHSFRVTFPIPNALFVDRLAGVSAFAAPAHYLRRYHPADGDQDLIAQGMVAGGFRTPRAFYNAMNGWRNPDRPQLWPWIYRTHSPNPPYAFVRNPYYYAVDEHGNQLPYLDRLLFSFKSLNILPLEAAAGGMTMQARHLRFEDYTLLMSERERGNYDVYHWFQGTRGVWSVFPNLNRRVDPDDPSSALKASLLADRRFRHALSLAIDRRAIIDAVYSGIGEPAQLDPGRESPHHHPPLFHAFTEHDPSRANALLDELGLTRRDSDGFRCRPDGGRLTFYLTFTEFTGGGPFQFVVDDWARVGLRVIPRDRARSLFYSEARGLVHDLTVWSGESEYLPLLQPRTFVPARGDSFYAQGWSWWYMRGGMRGRVPPDAPGVIVPPLDHPIRTSMQALVDASAAATVDDQVQAFLPALETAASELWSINIATPPPQPVVVRRGLRNVPRNAIMGVAYQTPGNTGFELYYDEHPSDSPGAIAQMSREILVGTPAPAIAAATGNERPGARLAALLRSALIAIAGLAILLAGLRHPFIGRRLATLVPTLAIISLMVFSIIQLPPGSFLETQQREADATQDPNILQAVREAEELFRPDLPFVARYLDWLGLRWFITFSREDLGLLQGFLGYSMESRGRVNDAVGDRVLLTVLISAFSILFTWAVALPVGIYSAVRQYSLLDYVFTVVGFVGMCVPGFLLALILMYWANAWFGIQVTGLFSPAYAAQPEWTWGKVADLLSHIWLPVVVLGLGGTGGMIRVMRANLLDELRKPYVQAARARGLHPLTLLLRYPVRLALNPFVSGIGGLFPALVSGGAIVSIVLSLPTVGPVMLSALLTEDLYLAGSMLMVLSVLAVLGTLVSDLLLLALDPRIRLEGGARG